MPSPSEQMTKYRAQQNNETTPRRNFMSLAIMDAIARGWVGFEVIVEGE